MRVPHHLVPLLTAVLAGALMRLWDLDGQSLWLDELYTVRVATTQGSDAVRQALAQDVHPPLYYQAMRLWAPVAGGDEALWRLPSALAGLLSIVFTWVFASRLAGPGAGALAAWLVALNPLAVDLDREVRGNAWMLLFTTAAAALAAGPAGRVPRWWLPAFGLCCGLSAWTHFYGALAVMGLLGWLLLRPDRVPGLVPAGLAGVGSLVLWLPVLRGQVSGFSADPWYLPAPPDSLAWLWMELWAVHSGPAVLCALLVGLGLARAPSAVLPLLTGLVALILVPQVLDHLAAPTLRPRNVLPLVPLVATAAAAGLASIRPVSVAVVASGLVLGAHALVVLPTQVLRPAGEDWRAAAAEVVARRQEGEPLVAVHPQLWRIYLGPDLLPGAIEQAPDAAAVTWVLLAHQLDPPGLAGLAARAGAVEESVHENARVLRLSGVERSLGRADFRTDSGEAPPAGQGEGADLHFYSATGLRSVPLQAQGPCRLGLVGRSEDAGGLSAILRVRFEVDGAVQLDQQLVPGQEEQWTQAVELRPELSTVIELAFVNDAIVEEQGGPRDRNAHVDALRLRCG